MAEWRLRSDGGWEAIDAVEEVAALVAEAREMSERNRVIIQQSRALVARVRRTRQIRLAWTRTVPGIPVQ